MYDRTPLIRDFYCRFGPLYFLISENKRKKFIKLVKSAAGEAYTSRIYYKSLREAFKK